MMKRFLIVLLCIAIVLLPTMAFAEGDTTENEKEESKTETTVQEEKKEGSSKKEESTKKESDKTENPKEETEEAPQEELPQVTVTAGQLSIDSEKLYEGMNKTYKKGYIPTIADGKVTIILPLVGKTFDNTVTLTADLGAPTDSPFVFGNYSQTAKNGEPYVFTITIPLAKGRLNGTYPVMLNASYIDATGNLTSQSFTIYVTITDGKEPAVETMTEPVKETVEKPELYIESIAIFPETVGGEQEFTVNLTVENIGNLRAKNILVTYSGGENPAIVPAADNNVIHLNDIKSGKTAETSFKLKTTKDILAGNQPFTVTLDYCDAYGGIYQSARQFLVNVVQPAQISYDAITVPKEVTAGDTMSLPANVFNIGKSTLRNVTITVEGPGLFPTGSVFLGDILPGEAGGGEMNVFVGMLSMSEGYTEDYGETNGIYTITYTDDAGETYTEDVSFRTTILQPVIEGEPTEEELKAQEEEKKSISQWWITILVAFAIIAIIITVIIVSKFARMMKMK